MSKKEKNFESQYAGMSQLELLREFNAKSDRMDEITDKCEQENRVRDEKEEREYKELRAHKQWIENQMNNENVEHMRAFPNEARLQKAEELIQKNVERREKTQIVFLRDSMMVADVDNGGLVQMNIMDIIKPLEEGFILDKLGLPFKTGLSGHFIWPVVEAAEATVLDEGVALTEQKINIDKLSANPSRVGAMVSMTNQSLNESNGYLATIVRKALPDAMRTLLNKIILAPTPVSEKAREKKFYGPFVDAAQTAVNLSSTPTYEEMNVDLIAAVLESGVEGTNLCVCMTKRMERILMGQPVNKEGVYVPMIQNHMFAGVPVYTSNTMRTVAKTYKKFSGSSWGTHEFNAKTDTVSIRVYGDTTAHAEAKLPKSASEGAIAEINTCTEYIGVGDFTYQPMGQFGSIRMIVDPFTKAEYDVTRFILNSDFGTITLLPEAFKLGKVAAKA